MTANGIARFGRKNFHLFPVAPNQDQENMHSKKHLPFLSGNR